jgi:methyltransferase family protein
MPFVPTQRYLDTIFQSEPSFCQLYPISIQKLDRLHWSPLAVVYKAAKFLADHKPKKILDIGSGSGKFCLAGAYYNPDAFFTGVEQRHYLVVEAKAAKDKIGRVNANFLHKNFTQIDLQEFESFYFYNPFFENLPSAHKIDQSIVYSEELYNYYSNYLSRQLEWMPSGTRVATYHSWNDEIPPGYQLLEVHFDNLLKFWIKV